MRIVFAPLAYTPSIGGSQAYSRGLAEALARRGHEVHVVVADVADAEAWFTPGHAPARLPNETIGGVSVRRVPLLRGRRRSSEPPASRELARFGRHLRRALARIEPDVVVTLPHLTPPVESVLALRDGAGWKAVYAPHLHEEDRWWPTERVAEAVRRADGVVALTTHERDRLVDAYDSGRIPIAIVPPGVEAPDAISSTTREPIVLFVGRRTESKRLGTLVDAMESVWHSHPDARLVVAGPAGPDDPIAGRELDPRVEVRGTVGPAERSALLESAMVVATASVIESFGLTTLEAWAHGAPVVVAETPVAASIVRDGTDGLLAGRSARGLADAISRLLSDPATAQAMGQAGRKRAVSEFTWERAGADLEELLIAL